MKRQLAFSAVTNKRTAAIALLTVLIAGCIFKEGEDNGTCNFGGPSTSCVPDAVNNRLDYTPKTGGKGTVHQTLGADSDPVDLWVFKSTVSGVQNLYVTTQSGCATVFLRECWFEPCDPGTLWYEAWQTNGIWYTDVCDTDGRKLVGSFNTTTDNHFLVGIADWSPLEAETIGYTFSIEPEVGG